jgi:transcriptional regulator with XRE-family HTH domain
MGARFETIPCSGPMTQDEKVFFKQLGARIAALRKEQGLTQVQLAERLGLTQQMIASYEVGRRRVPVSLLPQIADTLAASLDELIGKKGVQPSSKRGPTSLLQKQLERLSHLPKAQQKLVMQMLDGVLSQASR